MNRIDAKFQELREKKEKALITYVVAGDPNLDTTIELVLAMEKSGSDIIELGVPYSDPLADGKVIEQASARALAAGAKVSKVIQTVAKIREKSQVPLVFLVYYNSVFKYGAEKFMKEASEAGIDGVIIPDLPIEEREDTSKITDKYGIHLIPLVAPTSKDRIQKIAENGKGFVYCVTVAGVTGARDTISTNIKEYMELVSSYTNIPKALGFGISSPEMAKSLKEHADGVIIGSAIVKRVAEAKDSKEAVEKVSSFIKDVKAALK